MLISKHRLDALVDGTFAIAMTLLVIDLKLAPPHPEGSHELLQDLADLIPKFIGWVISFFVLGLFWWIQSRAFHFVKKIDAPLSMLNLLLLAFGSFLPFASGLTGEMPLLLVAQIVYSTTILGLSVSTWLIWRYIYRHPELCEAPLSIGTYVEARFRVLALITVCIVSVGIADFYPGFGNLAFLLMIPVGRIGARIRAQADRGLSEAERQAGAEH